MTASLSVDSTTFSSPWLTQREAADYARRGVGVINEALRTGQLRGFQSKPGGKGKRGGTWRVHVADLDAWIRGEDPQDAQTPGSRIPRI